MCWCRASLLAVAGSRRAALPGVGGILPLPFCREVVNDPSWLICGTDSLGVALVSPPFPSPDSGASRRFTWRLAILPGALRHKLSPLFPSFLLPRALLCHLPEVNNETMCLLSGNLGFQVLLLLGGPGQLSISNIDICNLNCQDVEGFICKKLSRVSQEARVGSQLRCNWRVTGWDYRRR